MKLQLQLTEPVVHLDWTVTQVTVVLIVAETVSSAFNLGRQRLFELKDSICEQHAPSSGQYGNIHLQLHVGF